MQVKADFVAVIKQMLNNISIFGLNYVTYNKQPSMKPFTVNILEAYFEQLWTLLIFRCTIAPLLDLTFLHMKQNITCIKFL